MDQLGRQYALADDAAIAIDVVEKGVDRLDALDQPFGKVSPFARGENAGDDVEGDDPLGRVLLPIDGEGDAELAEGRFGGLLAAREIGVGGFGDPALQVFEFGALPISAAAAPDFVERPLFPHLVA